jgi:hypothetical protein
LRRGAGARLHDVAHGNVAERGKAQQHFQIAGERQGRPVVSGGFLRYGPHHDRG